MTFSKAEVKTIDQLIVDSATEAISQLPIELDSSDFKENIPVIAIRNFEYILLDMEEQKECKISIQWPIKREFEAKVVLFDSKFNPGRAIIGINSNLRRLIEDSGSDFRLIISKTNN